LEGEGKEHKTNSNFKYQISKCKYQIEKAKVGGWRAKSKTKRQFQIANIKMQISN
jgi:hypothetical protein